MRKRLVDGLVVAAMFLIGVCGSGSVRAQGTQEVVLDGASHWDGRSFVLNLRGTMNVQRYGRWDNGSRLVEYAQMHRGEEFLVFEQGGVLYRLDTPAELRSLAELYQPLQHLGSLQSELAASMAPLSMQQAALGEQMRATHNYAMMGRIGRQQGSIGRRQGEIGREQGVIGRQQGVLGRALYQNAQEAIDRCLKEKSCAAVGPSAPAATQR